MSPKTKKILIALGILTVVLAATFYWMGAGSRKLSPGATAEGMVGTLRVEVDYSRPSMRGRLIFGTAEQGALIQYGRYWRLGANAPTSIEFSEDVLFNGAAVKAGKYRLYAVPGEADFELVLNSKLGWSGAPEPDYDKDVLRTRVAVGSTAAPVEQFTISVLPADAGLTLQIEWSGLVLRAPVVPAGQ